MAREEAAKAAQAVLTRKQETDQIATAKIVRNVPLSQEFMALGYNRENILDRIARADFWNFGVSLNPAHVEEYSPTGYINAEEYARSTTLSYGINSNQFIWDSIPELENFPVSGRPEEVSQQYVMYNVDPGFLSSAKKSLHISQQSIPTAYGVKTDTSKTQTLVYQVPVSDLVSSMSGISFFRRIKRLLIGK